MLALYRFLTNEGNSIECLINMCDEHGEHSRSHGIKNSIIAEQAKKMRIPILQPFSSKGEYEKNFRKAILSLKEKGIEAGVFGDIYLQEHRNWIEHICNDLGIEAVFPLWENNTAELLKEFVAVGFKTIVVAVNLEKLSEDWLGRIIDQQFVADINTLPEIDPCAENGEYHSFVFDGPLFSGPVIFTKGEYRKEGKHVFLELF